MNKFLIFLLTGLLCVLFVACSHSENVEKETESIGVEENAFVWQPSFMNDCGSASTNRSGLGIIDGKNDILYYQAASIENDTMYSLYSYDENTNKSEELAPDCYGMINVTDTSVFYIGHTEKGIYRYDIGTKDLAVVYSGEVLNLLATGNYLYYINDKNEFFQIDPYSSDRFKIMEGISADYLECVNNNIYFSKMNEEYNNYDLYKIAVGSPQYVTDVYDHIPYPLQILDSNIVCRDNEGIYLINTDTKDQTTIITDHNESFVAANGNGVFYTQTDQDGYSELYVYDLTTNNIICLMPVHCTTVYFLNNNLYLVDIVNFKVEKAVFEENNIHTKWIIQ